MNRLKGLFYYIILYNVAILMASIFVDMQSSSYFLFKMSNNGYTLINVIGVLIILKKNMEMVNKLTRKKISCIGVTLILINGIFLIYSFSESALLIDWQFATGLILVADTVLNIIGSIAVIMLFNKEASKQEFKLAENHNKISDSL